MHLLYPHLKHIQKLKKILNIRKNTKVIAPTLYPTITLNLLIIKKNSNITNFNSQVKYSFLLWDS